MRMPRAIPSYTQSRICALQRSRRYITIPVWSAPGYLAPQLPTEAPEAGEPFEAVMRDVDDLIVPGTYCHGAPLLLHWRRRFGV